MSIGPMGQNLIFLISQPRTGSTLLQRILGCHPQIATTTESWLMIPPLLGLTNRWSSPEGRESKVARQNIGFFLRNWPEGENDYFEGMRRMYGYLYNRSLERTGKSFFLDKTPRYAYFIPELYRLFPNAQFLFLIRNPLAVLCSIINTWTGINRRRLYKEFGDDLLMVPKLITEGIKEVGERAICVHYEQLVSDPAIEIRKICGKLGLPFSEDVLQYHQHGLPRWLFGDHRVYQYSTPVDERKDNWKTQVKNPWIWEFADRYLAELGQPCVEQLGYPFHKLRQTLDHVRRPTIWMILGKGRQGTWALIDLTKRRIPKALSFFSMPAAIVGIGEIVFRIMGLRRRFLKQGQEFSQAQKILVVRADAIGDLILTSPFLRELRRNAPQARITLLVNDPGHNLLGKCPYIDELIIYPFSSYISIMKLREKIVYIGQMVVFAAKHLWKKGFDLALHPRWSTDHELAQLLTYLSGAPTRVGFCEDVNYWKERSNRGFNLFLTRRIPERTLKHETEYVLDLIRSLGGFVHDDHLEIWIDQDDERFAQEALLAHAIKENELLVCFVIGARVERKIWPAQRFAEVGEWLCENGQARILLLGNSEEIPLGEEFQSRFAGPKVINMIGKTTLRQAAALIKHCHFYVGNDTGLMHIAAALNKPVIEVSLWPQSGPIDSDYGPYRYTPWRVTYLMVHPAHPLRPCYQRDCKFREPHCILQVEVPQVIEAVKKLLFLLRLDQRFAIEVPEPSLHKLTIG